MPEALAARKANTMQALVHVENSLEKCMVVVQDKVVKSPWQSHLTMYRVLARYPVYILQETVVGEQVSDKRSLPKVWAE